MRFDFAAGFALPAVAAPLGPNKPGLKLAESRSAAPGVPGPEKPIAPGYWPEVSASDKPRVVPGPGIGWAYSDLR